MKRFTRIICIVLILLSVITLTSCKKDKIDKNVDHGYVEGYYSELAYETKIDGTTTELIYILCTDEELTDAVGKKVVSFDTEGNMTEYTITFGAGKISRLIAYKCSDIASYYSDISFDENEKMTEASYENVTTNTETGDVTKTVGSQTYFENGKVKSETSETYVNDKLDSKVEREYNEAGELVNETIK